MVGGGGGFLHEHLGHLGGHFLLDGDFQFVCVRDGGDGVDGGWWRMRSS